jgi:Fe-S oxidoreductase
MASVTPQLANAVMRRRSLGAIAKAFAGVDQRRDLPVFARKTFRQWWRKRAVVSGAAPAAGDAFQTKKVLLWVDSFTNHFSPEVGRAAVEVLESAGYSVELTRKKVCCGLTWISTGQLDGARRQLTKSLDAVAGALSEGTPIVGLEPSCTAVLRSDIVELLGDDVRSAKLAAQTFTLAEILQRTPGWQAPDLSDVHGVAQPHCHQHAVMGWNADKTLLAEAGADIEAVGGCCGLAGNFGVEKGHYDVSVAVAENALLPALRSHPDGVVLADGFSCRTQLEQLADREGLHLAQVLADALRRQARMSSTATTSNAPINTGDSS